jgi:uncharacterized RDD family membrane protein YckC
MLRSGRPRPFFDDDSREELPFCAGLLRRSLATLVDMAIFVGCSAALAIPLAQARLTPDTVKDFDLLLATLTDPSWLSHASGSLGIWIAAWWGYFIVGWGLLGGTPGKYVVGLRIVDHEGRCPIGGGRALLRLVAYMVSSMTLGLGHMLVLIRRDHRAMHDILAGTRVVRLKDARRHGFIKKSFQNDSEPSD